MPTELKAFRWSCDNCKKIVIMYAANEWNSTPEGWTRHDWYCGDGYCDGHDAWWCEDCS